MSLTTISSAPTLEKLFQVCVRCLGGFSLGMCVARGLTGSIIRVEFVVPWIFYSLVLPVLACRSPEQLQGRLISN